MVFVGAATAFVLAGAATLLTRQPLPWQAHLGVIIAAAVAIPLAVAYAVLRAYSLTHRDVRYVAKQAAREAYIEATALRQSRTAPTVAGDTTPIESSEHHSDSESDTTDESSPDPEPTTTTPQQPTEP